MATTEQQPILFINSETDSADGVLHLRAYDKADRIRRAIKTWIGYWIGAFIAIYPPLLIPGPHLAVTIPLGIGLVIAGPIVAYRRYRDLNTPEKATGQCPVCGKEVTIPLEPKERPSLWKYCPACNKPLQLVDKNSEAGGGA